MKKLLTLLLLGGFSLSQSNSYAQCADGFVEVSLSSVGGDWEGEKWMSITTEENGAGDIIWSQGETDVIGNESGLLTNELICLEPDVPYYLNAYDEYADSWDDTTYSLEFDGVVLANNGGNSPDDGTDNDDDGTWEGIPEELETSEAFIIGVSNNDFLSFEHFAQVEPAVIDVEAKTILLTVSGTTDITNFIPTFSYYPLASISAAGETPVSGVTTFDFSTANTFTITSYDGEEAVWTVTVENDIISTEKEILTYSIDGVAGVIEGNTISITLPYTAVASDLVADFTISEFASILIGEDAQVSGETSNDFTEDVVYTVVAEDESTQDYTVSVTVEEPGAGFVCESAIEMTFPMVDFAGSTEGFGDDYNELNGCSNSYILGDDLVYTFTLDESRILVGDITGNYVGMTILDDCPSNAGNCLVQATGFNGGSFEPTVLDPGTYYAIISTYPFPQFADFVLNIDMQPIDNSIIAYSFEEQTGPAVINAEAHTIDVEVSSTTDLTALVANFEISALATIAIGDDAQVSGTTANDFTTPVTYTVSTFEGATEEWVVTVTNAIGLSDANDIIAYSVDGNEATIEGTTISLDLPYNYDATAIVADFEISQFATVAVGETNQVSGTTANDFTAPVVYAVTAENGDVQEYTVTITVAEPGPGVLCSTAIELTLPVVDFEGTTEGFGDDYSTQDGCSNLYLGGEDLVYTFTLEEGGVVTGNIAGQYTGMSILDGCPDDGGQCLDVASGSTFGELDPLVLEAGTYYAIISTFPSPQFAPFTMNLSVAPLSDENDVISFSLEEQTGDAVIDAANHTIAIEVGFSIDLTSLVPTFGLSADATAFVGEVAQTSGVTANDFSTPVVYGIEAQNGTIQEWTVTVTNSATASAENDMLAFGIDGTDGVIDGNSILVSMPFGADVAALTADFTVPAFATVTVGEAVQVSGETENDFTVAVVYTVTAENGNAQSYSVTVEVSEPDNQWCVGADETLTVNGMPIEGQSLEAGTSHWYVIDVDQTYEDVEFSTCGASFDTRLAVFYDCEGTGTGTLGIISTDDPNVLVYNDDDPGDCPNYASLASVNTLEAGTYYLVVYGYSASSNGNFDLSVTGHIYGCTDETALNYDPNATTDDGTCEIPVVGCTDETALNYNPNVTEGFENNDLCNYCAEGVSVNMSLTVAGFGEEMNWQLLNAANEVVAERNAAPYDYAYEAGNTYPINFCLEAGEMYTFEAIDTAGDGWFEGTTYEISSCDTEVILANNSGNTPNNGTDGEGEEVEVSENFTPQFCPGVSPWVTETTINTHTILIPSDLVVDFGNGTTLENGDFIGVFYELNGEWINAGAEMWTGGNEALTAYGADLGDTNGFQPGEQFKWMIWDISENTYYEMDATYQEIGGAFTDQELFAVNGISGLATMFPYVELVASQEVSLRNGWGLMSSYMTPENADLAAVMAPVTDNLVIVKDENGQVYWPEYAINGIGSLDLGSGYFYKNEGESTLSVDGAYVQPEETTLTIEAGWGIIGYLRTEAAAIETLLEPITDDIFIVKDEDGQVYWPAFNVNGIVNMQPGKGYQVKMNNEVSYTYPANSADIAAMRVAAPLENTKYVADQRTGRNMVLGLPLNAWEVLPTYGAEVAVFDAAGNLVGSTVFQGSNTVVTLWGDDLTTTEKDGLVAGENWTVRVADTYGEYDLVIENWEMGTDHYQDNGVSVAGNMRMAAQVEKGFALFQNVPNPSTSLSTIGFYVPQTAEVNVQLYNVLGELVLQLTNDTYEAGYHEVKVNTNELEAGSYFYKMQSGNFVGGKQMHVIH